MKVLQLTKFYPPVLGGIESVAFELTEGLNQRGIPTDVLCANISNVTTAERMASGYQVTRVASCGKFLSTSMAPAMLRIAGSAFRSVDVIHIHLPDPLTNLALWLNNPAAKIVVHWHSDIVAQRRALRIYAPLQNWLLRKASAIIATSVPYAESSPWLQPFIDKVTVIPIGIRKPSTKASEESVQRLRNQYPGKRIIFSIGRMTYYKGFGVLIDAAEHLPTDCMVVVGGAGELLESYRALVHRRGLQDRIVFIGKVSDADLPAHYAASSVFCLPSIARSEAFGVVLLEAMAYGKAIVTTNIQGSGVPWVNLDNETGLNVEPNNSHALALGLCKILECPDRLESFAKNSRARYLSHFTAETMVDRVNLLYESII